MEQAKAVPIAERLREIKIGGYTVDNGSHSKHFAVRAVCEEAAAEIERANEHERQLKGECLLLADVLRDAYEVIKTIEGEDTDESDKLNHGNAKGMEAGKLLFDTEVGAGRTARAETAKNVFAFPATTTMTPEQALRSALEFATNDNLQDVLVVGYDGDGALLVRSSRMDRKEALWLSEQLRKHALSEDA